MLKHTYIRYRNIVIALIVAGLFSCSDDLELISVERKDMVEFSVVGDGNSWRSQSAHVLQGPSVIKLAGDPAQPTKFQRYFMVAEGTTPDSRKFELTLTFDVASEADMRNVYTPIYTERGGLDRVTLITQTANQYSVSEVCVATTEVAMEIERQSRNEKLLRGVFHVELCTEGTGDVIQITQGTFRDVNY